MVVKNFIDENIIWLLSELKQLSSFTLYSPMQMNVVMPTAMTSMHTDPELSNNAAKTAKRGIRVLKYLQDKDDSVKTNCDAIRVVATGNGADSCVEERVEVSKEKEGGITICLVGSIFCDRVHYVFIIVQ